MICFTYLLAQGGGTGSPTGPGPGVMLIGLVLMMGVYFFVMHRGNRSEQKKRQSMLETMKKNDRVMTMGGVIGRVVSVKDNEVVLKVDESSNTKMTFIRRSIQQVLSDDDDLSSVNK